MAADRGPLGGLIERRARLDRIAALLGSLLPTPLDRHCRVANLAQDVLVLQVDAPVWLTRLRLERPRLIAALRAHPEFAGVQKLQLRTAPEAATGTRPPPPRTSPVLPAAAAAQLRATASALSDPGLREALLRLARRAERSA
jgi:hypothetical protein